MCVFVDVIIEIHLFYLRNIPISTMTLSSTTEVGAVAATVLSSFYKTCIFIQTHNSFSSGGYRLGIALARPWCDSQCLKSTQLWQTMSQQKAGPALDLYVTCTDWSK